MRLLCGVPGASVRTFSLTVLFLAALPANQAIARCDTSSNTYVRSLETLATHEQIHALNVEMLMIRNALAHPERYRSIYPLILDYGRTHDRPKWQDPELLRRLCETYKENLEITPDLADAEKQRRLTRRNWAIQPINEAEDRLKLDVFVKQGLTTPDGQAVSSEAARKLQLLKELEKVADNVERVANPITPEELGKKQMNAAVSFSRYLAPSGDESLRRQLESEALELHDHYNKAPGLYMAHVPLLRGLRPGSPVAEESLRNAVRRSEDSWRKSSARLQAAYRGQETRIGYLPVYQEKDAANCADFYRRVGAKARPRHY